MTDDRSLIAARTLELIREMASIVAMRWRHDGLSTFDGIVERLEIEEALKTQALYVSHALSGEAYSAFMFSENPELSPDAKQAYRWAEEQFNRIARGQVGERDLIG